MDDKGNFVLRRLTTVGGRAARGQTRNLNAIQEEDDAGDSTDSLEQDYFEEDEEGKEDATSPPSETPEKKFDVKPLRDQVDNGYGGMTFDSLDGEYIYRVGVIDFITKHDFSKSLETAAKTFIFRVDAGSISA